MKDKLLAQIVWLAVAGTLLILTALQLMGVIPGWTATVVGLVLLGAAWFGLKRRGPK